MLEPFAYRVFHVHVFCLFFFFFFFFRVNSNLTWVHCSYTVYYCLCTVYVLKNIKNGSHNTIYTFKNYFTTVFSVFSFQFSVTISSIQTDPISQCIPSYANSFKHITILLYIYIYIYNSPIKYKCMLHAHIH